MKLSHFAPRYVFAAGLIMAAAAAPDSFVSVAFAQESAAIVPSRLTFASNTALNVDATSIELKIGEIPPREYPHVNYRSQVRFEDAAREWAAVRYKMTGNSVNKLRINVRKGDIIEKLLPVKKGIKGWFTKDQAAEYIATLELDVAIVDPNGQVLATASGKSSTSRTVVEGATDADKQQVWTGLIVSAFDALDAELQPQLRQTMAQYIR